MNKRTESDILRSICEYLHLKGYFFWRSNNIPVYDIKRRCMRSMPKFSIKGVSDILLVVRGQLVCIEVKTPKGKQSDFQKEFERKVGENGGKYILATHINDIIENKI